MKILHITPHYHPALGGCETFTREISERLAQRGHDVTVLSLHSGARDLPEEEVINDVKLNRFRPAGRFRDLVGVLLNVSGAHRLASMDKVSMFVRSPYGLRAFRYCLRHDSDVVAVINWYGGWLPYQACLAKRIRGFALVGVPLFHTEIPWSRAEHFTHMLEDCDGVLALTDYEKKFIEGRSPRVRARAIGAGVDPQFSKSADGRSVRCREGIGSEPVVGYVGRMDASKGVATVIRAMKVVWQKEPKAHLLLAGAAISPDVPGQDEIAKSFGELSDWERSRVILISNFTNAEKASIFDALDVFVMPSVAESFGIGYVEAWSCSKAVIGSNIGSTQCVIEHGVDGLLVEPGNTEALARAIWSLLSDSEMRQAMGKRGCDKTVARYTWDRITDQVEQTYREVCAAKVVAQSAPQPRKVRD